jgi:hypothetical protein
VVFFYDVNWRYLGRKISEPAEWIFSLAQIDASPFIEILSEITNIPSGILDGMADLEDASIAQKMWQLVGQPQDMKIWLILSSAILSKHAVIIW